MANDFTSTSVFGGTRGYLEWVRCLSKGKIIAPVWLADDGLSIKGANKGVGGDTSQMILDRVQSVIDMGVDVCIVDSGGNDITTESFETIVDNIQKTFDALLDAGIFVISLAIHPFGS
jgi:hypothetical protein